MSSSDGHTMSWLTCRAVIGVGLLSASVAGCAQSRVSTAWQSPSSSPVQTPAPTLTLEIHARYLMFEEPEESHVEKWWSSQRLQSRLDTVIAEFPFLANAQPAPAGEAPPSTDYRLVVEATHAIRGNDTLHWLSSTTPWIIPSAQEGVIELEGRVYRGSGFTPAARYQASGQYKVKRWLLFLVMPWWWGYGVSSEVAADAFRELFWQIQRDAPRLFQAGGRA